MFYGPFTTQRRRPDVSSSGPSTPERTTELSLLQDLGLIVLTGAVILFVARTVRVPAIVAYMVGGLVLGPGAGLVQVTPSIQLIAEVGVALLLFLVGTELSVQRARSVGSVVLLGGVVQVALTFLLGLGAGLATGYDGMTAALLGLALAFSSTVVVVKLLDARGELDATHGRIAVGILLVQDVLVAVALTLLGGLGESVQGAAGLARGLGLAALGIIALAALAAFGARTILPRLFDWLSGASEEAFVVSLTWCFLFILGAEALHLSVELGSFLAGVAIGQLPRNEELRRRVHPVVNFFLAVFFVSLGVRMDPGAAWEHAPTVLVLTVLAVVAKPVLVMAMVPRFGFDARTGFLAGLGLGQISEFSVILVGLAVASGLAAEALLSVTGMVAILSIAVSAFAVPVADRMYDAAARAGLVKLLRAPVGAPTPAAPHRRGHVVVVGMNTLGRRIVERLAGSGIPALAVDTDPGKLAGLPVPTLVGAIETPDVFEAAGVPEARLVVSALQIENVNALLAYRCRRLGIPVSIHAFDAALAQELLAIGADHVMISKYEGIRQVAASLREAGVIGA